MKRIGTFLLLLALCWSGEETAAKSSEVTEALEKLRSRWIIGDISVPGLPSDEVVYRRVDELMVSAAKSSSKAWVTPSSSLYALGGFGLNWTDVSFGSSVERKARLNKSPDAVWFLSVGLGNSSKLVGLEITYGDLDVDSPFNMGGFSLKAHRVITPTFGVAVGWTNAVLINTPSSGSALYAAGTKIVALRDDPSVPFSQLIFNFGAGNGALKLERDITAQREAIGLFAAVGLRVLPPLVAIFDWTSTDLAAGVSVAPFRRFPISFGAGCSGLTRPAQGVGYLVTVGYSDSVVSDSFPVGIFRN